MKGMITIDAAVLGQLLKMPDDWKILNVLREDRDFKIFLEAPRLPSGKTGVLNVLVGTCHQIEPDSELTIIWKSAGYAAANA